MLSKEAAQLIWIDRIQSRLPFGEDFSWSLVRGRAGSSLPPGGLPQAVKDDPTASGSEFDRVLFSALKNCQPMKHSQRFFLINGRATGGLYATCKTSTYSLNPDCDSEEATEWKQQAAIIADSEELRQQNLLKAIRATVDAVTSLVSACTCSPAKATTALCAAGALLRTCDPSRVNELEARKLEERASRKVIGELIVSRRLPHNFARIIGAF